MGTPLRVLIIEDFEDDALLLVRELQRGGYEVEFERVETAEAMQSALTQKTWDLILTDYTLPGFNALQALEVLKASGLDLPFILVSGTIGEDTVVSALKAGASDFLVKGKFARLGPAIERELQEAKARREHKRAQEALKSSEARYRLAARATNDVIWEWDLKNNERTWSENAQSVFGFTPEEIATEAAWWDEHIHPEDRERVVASIYALLESSSTIWAAEYRSLRRDGSTAYIADRGYVERDADGKPLRMIGALSDITERKQAEDQVRAQAARLKVLADASQAFSTSVQDYQGMLDLVARQIAEALGGVSGIRLLSDDGEWLEMASIYEMDPESLEFAQILSDQTPLRADEPNSSQHIMQSSQALLLPGVSEEQLRTLVKPEHWPKLKNVASHSWLLAPMGARGQDIGMLVISRKPGLPAFDEQDLSLAQDLADRAALTISNARLFKQVQNELTDRKQAEEALRESQARLAGIIESAMDAIITIDEKQCILLFNPAAEHMFRCSAADMLGQPLERLLPERFHSIHREHVRIFGETNLTRRAIGNLGDLRGLRADGEEFFIEASVSQLEASGQNFYTVILRDITERKQAEATLNQQQQTYQTLLNAMSDLGKGVAVANDKARLVFVNEAFCRIAGYTADELLNIPSTWDLMLPEDVGILQTQFQQRIRGELVPDYIDLTIIRKDGVRVTVEMAIKSLSDNEELKFIIIARDITERKQAEEALLAKNEEIKIMSQQMWQAAKLATMGELAASIAHELNNPLATVSLRTEMLMAQFSPNAPQSRSLQIIDSEVKRMGALVANLLQFSRTSSTQISTVDVREEVADTLELIHYHLRKYNILTVQELSPETPLIQVDRQQLRQVFLNLFTNAADSMPQGGTLTIRTWPGEKAESGTTAPLRLSATPSLGLPVSKVPQMFIEASDTGEGISPERLERVWEPFFTTKPEGKGTGLGLAICRRIIYEHGGTIEIISDGIPGKGTTVRITLPAVNAR